MKNKLLLLACCCICLLAARSQTADKNHLRIVDSLSRQERATRTPVILKTELDSLIQVYNESHPPMIQVPPVTRMVNIIPVWVYALGGLLLLLIGVLLYFVWRYQRKFTGAMRDLRRLIGSLKYYAIHPGQENAGEGETALAKKVRKLSSELEELQHRFDCTEKEYESLRKSIGAVYKIRSYPFYHSSKQESELIRELMATEKTVATHAFEKFVRPVMRLADANKNTPAKISSADREKMLELLFSLSLYYIEYLYLRIGDLAVGGNMVQRIGSNGRGIDPGLLKKLNKEHGSRALVVRMALDQSGIGSLSYPVFDETYLNPS